MIWNSIETEIIAFGFQIFLTETFKKRFKSILTVKAFNDILTAFLNSPLTRALKKTLKENFNMDFRAYIEY